MKAEDIQDLIEKDYGFQSSIRLYNNEQGIVTCEFLVLLILQIVFESAVDANKVIQKPLENLKFVQINKADKEKL